MSIDNDVWTIQKLILWTTSYFKKMSVESPRISAETLLAFSLGLKRIDLYLLFDKPLNKEELQNFKSLIKRRAKSEPVAYILNEKEFWSKVFFVTPDVLIPRPETECMVEIALKHLSYNNTMRVLELGTGSGAIIISIASEQKKHIYFATDYSIKAINIAKKNAINQGLDRKISFIVGDWTKPFKNHPPFDMIISNPPYISSASIHSLQKEIINYEPMIALESGPDGLNSLNFIVNNAHQLLTLGGTLILEIGFDQSEKILDKAKLTKKYINIECIKDYSGNNRVLILEKRD